MCLRREFSLVLCCDNVGLGLTIIEWDTTLMVSSLLEARFHCSQRIGYGS